VVSAFNQRLTVGEHGNLVIAIAASFSPPESPPIIHAVHRPSPPP
jgi:hypothetical protein